MCRYWGWHKHNLLSVSVKKLTSSEVVCFCCFFSLTRCINCSLQTISDPLRAWRSITIWTKRKQWSTRGGGVSRSTMSTSKHCQQLCLCLRLKPLTHGNTNISIHPFMRMHVCVRQRMSAHYQTENNVKEFKSQLHSLFGWRHMNPLFAELVTIRFHKSSAECH